MIERADAGGGWVAFAVATTTWVEAGGGAERLREWLGGEELPLCVTDGQPGIHRVAIATSDAELVIE